MGAWNLNLPVNLQQPRKAGITFAFSMGRSLHSDVSGILEAYIIIFIQPKLFLLCKIHAAMIMTEDLWMQNPNWDFKTFGWTAHQTVRMLHTK